ncbi:hypothetical protein PENTCL1PPCAC_14609, partial [Pristionchus entomophagus]
FSQNTSVKHSECRFSATCFLFGATHLFFAYNATFQGTMIAPAREVQIPYDDMLNGFAIGEKRCFFRTRGLLEFIALPVPNISSEEDPQKLVDLMCGSPGSVIASLYE